ncbi:MAG TPA: outer membrane protein assembly factor BamE [Xanthomonadales bacterium]|nr:outer membrane protein assembly factor BamE [Xanthomonadales bacterium]
MSIRYQSVFRLLACMILAFSVSSACGLIYKQNIQQGNALEEEDLEQLYIGMNQRQVLFVLGSPSIKDPFLSDRWDYVQTFSRRGDEMVQRTVTLRFENDLLSEIIGVDQTPSALVDESTLNDSVVVSSDEGNTESESGDSEGLDFNPTDEERAVEVGAEDALSPEADVQGIGTPSAQEMEYDREGDDAVTEAEQDYNYVEDEIDEANAEDVEMGMDRGPDDGTSPDIDG